MSYLRLQSEGERLVVSRSRAPEAMEGVVCGALCTLLCAGAWKAWQSAQPELLGVLCVLALVFGAVAARCWRQFEASLSGADRWVFDRSLDVVECGGHHRCVLSEVAEVRVDEVMRVEARSLRLRTRGGAVIRIEERSLPCAEMEDAARRIAEFARVEVVVERDR